MRKIPAYLFVAFATVIMPLSVGAQESPHTLEAVQAISSSLQTHMKTSLEAYGKADYRTACTSLALAVGDSKTLRWHNQGLINEIKAKNEDASDFEAELVKLDDVIVRLEARTREVCAKAQ